MATADWRTASSSAPSAQRHLATVRKADGLPPPPKFLAAYPGGGEPARNDSGDGKTAMSRSREICLAISVCAWILCAVQGFSAARGPRSAPRRGAAALRAHSGGDGFLLHVVPMVLPERLKWQDRVQLWQDVAEAEFEAQHLSMVQQYEAAFRSTARARELMRRDAYVVLEEAFERALAAGEDEEAKALQVMMIQVGAPPRAPKALAGLPRRRSAGRGAASAGGGGGGPAILEAEKIREALSDAAKNARSDKMKRWLDDLRAATLGEEPSVQRRAPEVRSSAPALSDQLRKGSIRVSTTSRVQTRSVEVSARSIYLKKELFRRAAELPDGDCATSRSVAAYLRSLKPPADATLADPSICFFLFRFTITNNADVPLRLVEGRWDIESAGGASGEVVTSADALPKEALLPGESVEISEACALQLPEEGARRELDGVRGNLARSVFGRVSGSYAIEGIDGTGAFDAKIEPFYLVKKAELPW